MFPPSGMLLVNKIILEIMCSVIRFINDCQLFKFFKRVNKDETNFHSLKYTKPLIIFKYLEGFKLKITETKNESY